MYTSCRMLWTCCVSVRAVTSTPGPSWRRCSTPTCCLTSSRWCSRWEVRRMPRRVAACGPGSSYWESWRHRDSYTGPHSAASFLATSQQKTECSASLLSIRTSSIRSNTNRMLQSVPLLFHQYKLHPLDRTQTVHCTQCISYASVMPMWIIIVVISPL